MVAVQAAERIMTAQLGAEHPLLEEIVGLRSAFEVERGDWDEAIVYARRAAEIAARAQGERDSATWRRRNDLAIILILSAQSHARDSKAVRMMEADRLLEGVIGDSESDGKRYGDAYVNRVATLLYFERLDDARRHARVGYEDAVKKGEKDEIALRNAEIGVARLRIAEGRREEAAATFAAVRQRLSPLEKQSNIRYDMQFMAHTLIVRTAILQLTMLEESLEDSAIEEGVRPL
jgi:hypothetical protein